VLLLGSVSIQVGPGVERGSSLIGMAVFVVRTPLVSARLWRQSSRELGPAVRP
jgi:hypothetical protein